MIFIFCTEKLKQNCNSIKQKTLKKIQEKQLKCKAVLHLLLLCVNPFSSLTQVHLYINIIYKYI